MEILEKLKQVIFKKLYKDLSHVEIIPYEDSIYFIDREKKYWYFEYEHKGVLYWNYSFFSIFFKLFSIERPDFELIMSEWVEEVLNCKIDTTCEVLQRQIVTVEEVLNCKIDTTALLLHTAIWKVEEVLNCNIDTTAPIFGYNTTKVGEVLNCKVTVTDSWLSPSSTKVDDILNHEIKSTFSKGYNALEKLEKVLNKKD